MTKKIWQHDVTDCHTYHCSIFLLNIENQKIMMVILVTLLSSGLINGAIIAGEWLFLSPASVRLKAVTHIHAHEVKYFCTCNWHLVDCVELYPLKLSGLLNILNKFLHSYIVNEHGEETSHAASSKQLHGGCSFCAYCSKSAILQIGCPAFPASGCYCRLPVFV